VNTQSKTRSPALPGVHDRPDLVFTMTGIRTHGLNDQEMIELAAFEECWLLTGELGHAEDYP
jgi:hypothetical protein